MRQSEGMMWVLLSSMTLITSIWISLHNPADDEREYKITKICDGVVLSHVIVDTIMTDVGVDPEHYAVLKESVRLCMEIEK